MLQKISTRLARWVTLILSVFCLSGMLLYSTDASAQNQSKQTKITIDAQSRPLREVMNLIEEQTTYKFFYNNNLIDVSKKVSISVKEESINRVLDRILKPIGIDYKIEGNSIVPHLKKVVDRTVTGVIVDRNNYPVIGAGVLETGKEGNGVISDIDGKFTLTVSSADAEIVISCLGYVTETVKAQLGKKMRIVLREDSIQLEETVIVGYGVQDKKTMTGAASVVTTKDMELNTATSISHVLAGKAAGFNVSQVSAQPGGGTNFNIRGAASTGAGNAPLFVVDGVPLSSSENLGSGSFYESGSTDTILESLNPEDVESITVLKDAASTAIYGARAGHGVILITTKRGKNHAPRIIYSGSGSFQTPRSNFKVLDTREYLEWLNIQKKEEWMKVNGQGIYADYIKAPEFVPEYQPVFSEEDIANAKGTDWLDAVQRNGYMHQHNLSVNGGTETTRYLASLSYMKQQGIVKSNAVDRMTARLNLDQDAGKYVTLGITANFSSNNYDNVAVNNSINEQAGVISSAVTYNPTIPIYDENGKYALDPYRTFAPNPVSLLDISDVTNKLRLMGSAYVSVKPVKGLELKANFSGDLNYQKRKTYLPKTTLAGANYNGKADISQTLNSAYVIDVTAQYKNIWGKHKFTALAGYSFTKNKWDGFSAGNRDFLIDGFLANNLAAGNYSKPTVGSWLASNTMSSVFGRVNYSYGDRYIVEATVRGDGASNFAKGHRWGVFPSISAAWLITGEDFMKGASHWLSNMKLRASYGETGNSNIGYRIADFYGVTGNYVAIGDRGVTMVKATQLGNPNITWETTREVNVGLDLGFFNERLKLSAEYFYHEIDDLLIASRPLPSYNEINTVAGNSGKTQSKGFELTINSINFDKRDFGWSTDLTLSHYEDKWKERDPWWKPAPHETPTDPIRGVWAYNSLGIMQPGEPAPEAQKDLVPGQVKLEDINKDGLINEHDLVFRGSSDPKLVFGFNNTFRYKNLDMSIYFYGRIGELRNQSYYESWGNMAYNNVSTYVSKRFYSGNLTGTAPTFLPWSDAVGDFYLKKIFFLRCGNITLGYRFPINTRVVKNLRVYADVHNPFVITNWTGLDPETDNGDFPYPNVTSFNLGLSISF